MARTDGGRSTGQGAAMAVAPKVGSPSLAAAAPALSESPLHGSLVSRSQRPTPPAHTLTVEDIRLGRHSAASACSTPNVVVWYAP